MSKRIAIIQGHPDSAGNHFCHALADTYASSAGGAGHEVLRIELAALDFPLLRTKQEFESEATLPAIAEAQDIIRWANHLMIVYPLWLGTMPALLKGFLEQTFRPGFAFSYAERGLWTKELKGRSARVVVTMGMPALAYRFFYGAHSLKSLERNILKFCGISPVYETLVGLVEGSEKNRKKALAKMEKYGRQGK
ncbi:MAG: flavodoxin family protein [Alphaproteobacteria bacterium]|nr:MAG: flavodoxin family protein [Alphaproteobacteria bacterium]